MSTIAKHTLIISLTLVVFLLFASGCVSQAGAPQTGIIDVTAATNTTEVSSVFYPSGWMGDTDDISIDTNSTDNPHIGSTCTMISYAAQGSQGWSGIYWQYPPSNWGDNETGRDLTGATNLTFWARGAQGGEKAEFKVGGITGEYPDSIQPAISTDVVTLSNTWTNYTIDLTNANLTHVIGGFAWVTNKDQNPEGCTIYLDDMIYQ